MNNGMLGWPGSTREIQKLCATNEMMSRQFFTASTTWVVPVGVIRVRASALGGGAVGSTAALLEEVAGCSFAAGSTSGLGRHWRSQLAQAVREPL